MQTPATSLNPHPSTTGTGPAGLDLLLHMGKVQARLRVAEPSGAVLAERQQTFAPLRTGPYPALDQVGRAAWLAEALASLGPLREQLARAVAVGPMAECALVDAQGLVLPTPDAEFEGFSQRPADWDAQCGPCDQTWSPHLPQGLNLATQFDWLERHHGADMQRGQWLPAAQYWAWWLSGCASSEVTALGCHSHLWVPAAHDYSLLARRRGWAQRLAPLRRAWEPLGPVRRGLARQLGLPADLQVHVGAVDLLAAQAAHLHAQPRLSLLRSGAWLELVVAGGLPVSHSPGTLGLVSVRGALLPSVRFPLAAELARLIEPDAQRPDQGHCGSTGAPRVGAEHPLCSDRLDGLVVCQRLSSLSSLPGLLAQGWLPLPGATRGCAPFGQRRVSLLDGQGLPADPQRLSPVERATLAAVLAAHCSAWLLRSLGGLPPLVLTGPLASNPVYVGALAALLPDNGLCCQPDARPLSEHPDPHSLADDGALQGAQQLLHWRSTQLRPPATRAVVPLPADQGEALRQQHRRWCAAWQAH